MKYLVIYSILETENNIKHDNLRQLSIWVELFIQLLLVIKIKVALKILDSLL